MSVDVAAMSMNENGGNISGTDMIRLRIYIDALKKCPTGFIFYRYAPPDQLFLEEGNPSAERILHVNITGQIGKEFNDIWPEDYRARVKAKYLEVLRTSRPVTIRDTAYELGTISKVLNIHAFTLSNDKLGVTIEDVTDSWLEVEKRRKAFMQIDRNIEYFATLIDEIRNPASAILHHAETCPRNCSDIIVKQTEKIESIVSRLEKGWLESEKVRAFLKRDILEEEG